MEDTTNLLELVDKFQGFAVENGRTINSGSNLYLEWFTKRYENRDLQIRLEAVRSLMGRSYPGFILEIKYGDETVLKVRADYTALGPTNIKTETYVPGTWEQKNLSH